jgi:hypothetical protein
VNATTTLDTLKSGTTQLAESTGQAVTELAGTAKDRATAVIGDVAQRIAQHTSLEPPRKKRHRGRLVLGIALGGAALGWAAKLARSTALGRRAVGRVLDLTGGRTNEPAVEPTGNVSMTPGTTA